MRKIIEHTLVPLMASSRTPLAPVEPPSGQTEGGRHALKAGVRKLSAPAPFRRRYCEAPIMQNRGAGGDRAMTDVISPTLGSYVHQEHDFGADPERVYEALLDETQFAAFSRAPAKIERVAGGSFTLVGGRVTGRNIELIPNRLIVQAWRVVPWQPGIYSIVRFELTAKGDGTHLVLDHSGFPPEDVAARDNGWRRVYFEPLRKYLDARP